MSITRGLRSWPWLLLIAALAVLFYSPVLFQQQTQVHAEGVSLGIALMHMLSSALDGSEGMLWTTTIYGGHPIFAEGQGGFANPLHLLLAWLLPPVPAYNIHQFLTMLISGAGAYGMCRAADCGRGASAFGSLALVFSTLWIGGVNNLAVASTMCWIPWAFWVMSVWLRRADLRSACAFGAVMALMVISGYPQLVHGALIYMTIYIGVQLVDRQQRRLLAGSGKQLVLSLLIAVVLALGLSAVQWIPLLELAQQSHRSQGISIIPQDNSTTTAFLRGFLYSFTNPENFPGISAGSGSIYFTGVGSLLVCLVFSTFVFFGQSVRMKGHLWATLFLTVLGFGTGGTPLFQLVYDLHLVPGLHSFRVSFTYLFVALVGFALIAAANLQQLARVTRLQGLSPRQCWAALDRRIAIALPLWVIAWLAALGLLHIEGVYLGQYYVGAVWLALVYTTLKMGMPRYIPALSAVLLTLEIVMYRIDSYDFGASSLITRPESIQALQGSGDLQDYKFADRTYAATYSLIHPKSPEVIPGLRKMLAAVTPAANALWGVSSLTGNLALGLERRTLADPLIDAELAPDANKTPGLRLIDFAAVKYLTVGRQFALPDFEEAYVDPDMQLRIVRNRFAYPRFQFFHQAVAVQSPDQAAAAVAALDKRALVVEYPPGELPGEMSNLEVGEHRLALLSDRSDRYELEIDTDSPVWLFLADANYPGWNAYLDGSETEVYSAQLIGKAVFIPAGEHSLKIVFEPLSVTLGLVITVVSGCSTLLLLAWSLLRRPGHRAGTPRASGRYPL